MEEKEQKEEEEAAADVHALRSVTSKDFNVDDFVPMQPAPTAVSMIFLCFILFFCVSLCPGSKNVMRLVLFSWTSVVSVSWTVEVIVDALSTGLRLF